MRIINYGNLYMNLKNLFEIQQMYSRNSNQASELYSYERIEINDIKL